MTHSTLRRGFSLIEILLAMAIGLTVCLVAFACFRMTAQTAKAMNRMALENRVLREGVLRAYDDLDFWILYDDPTDPSKQGLRSAEPVDFNFKSDRMLGSAFTPLKNIDSRGETDPAYPLGSLASPYPPIDASDGSDMVRRPSGSDPALPRWQALPGLASQAPTPVPLPTGYQDNPTPCLNDWDRHRGFDPDRPYMANDPRRWSLANFAAAPKSLSPNGRYGVLSNLRKHPYLGFGWSPDRSSWDPRDWFEPKYMRNDVTWHNPWGGDWYPPMENMCNFWFHRINYAFGSDSRNPSVAGSTGDYGATPEHTTWTWLANQQRFLYDAMGAYGLIEYMPPGTPMGYYGSFAPDPVMNAPLDSDLAVVAVDERQDQGLAHTFSIYRCEQPGYKLCSFPTAGTASLYNTYPLLPASMNSGAQVIGHSVFVNVWWWDSGYQDGTFSGPQYRINHDMTVESNLAIGSPLLKKQQRAPWYSACNFIEIGPLINRTGMVNPLMPQRPASYPDVQIGSFRSYVNGRFVSDSRVRWVDLNSGETAEVGVAGLGTTLRGARQQRRPEPSGGWAVFRGMWYDPSIAAMIDHPPSSVGALRNDPTLDSL